MNAKEIGQKLVELCKEGKNLECINTYYADDIVSVEAAAPPSGGDPVTKGIAGVRAKNEWWAGHHEVHGAEVAGPYPHGEDRFAVRFNYDITNKPSGQRMQMDEVGLFTVADGKIVKEEFFYDM
ncbi:MAG: nuclear transport factor 2 family protein [Deltaproteobacteria bacterium]|nr:MAG: nuclear transport factor 2 family protein [Deltaproteobacteria bacterium]